MGPAHATMIPTKGKMYASRLQENYRASKPGEVPVYHDQVNPKVYLRRVNDWIRFMALADKASSKSMTLGQQVFAIITNIRGTAGTRLEYIGDQIRPGLSEDSFYEIVDTVFNTIDPIDRESQFMDTSKLWMQLMFSTHRKEQAYDEFWKHFNNLALKYTHQHGDAAKQTGVQELLALLCLQNSKLGRTEFSTAVEASLRIQKEMDKSGSSMDMKNVPSYRSTKDTMSCFSPTKIGESSPSRVLASTEEQHGNTNILQMQRDISRIVMELDDQKDKLASLSESSDTGGDLKLSLTGIINALQSSSTQLVEMEAKVKQLSEVQASSEKEQQEKKVAPMMTLEAVRIALRRIDHVDNAIRPRKDADYKSHKTHAFGTLMSKAKGKCWICAGNHFAKDNPQCLRKLRERKTPQEVQGTIAQSAMTQKFNSKHFCDEEPTSTCAWGDTDCDWSLKTLTQTTTRIDELDRIDSDDIIIDGGATSTVAGILQYARYCDKMGIHHDIQDLPNSEDKWHAFGTESNYSKPQRILGYAQVPIPTVTGRNIVLKFKLIDGNVPMILGKDELRRTDAIEAHMQDWLELKVHNNRIRLQTKINQHDGHARLVLSGLDMRMNLIGSLIGKEMLQEDSNKMIEKIHQRTHFHPKNIEVLLKRSNKWHPSMGKAIQAIHDKCRTCKQTGDPEVMKKFNLNKIHKEFNNRVYMDLAFWDNKIILHMVDFATSYSEAWHISSRNLDTVLLTMDRIWNHKHGDFQELVVDQEFDNSKMTAWCEERRIKLIPAPSRRHNKAGVVERKNRVIKDILEKLTDTNLKQERNFNNILAKSVFLSNIMHGNRLLSSFEMVRGYTPSLSGTGSLKVPLMILQAEQEMQARRLLARVLKSRPLPKPKPDVNVGDQVLILVPGGLRKRGKWVEETVSATREDGSLVCGKGRNRKVIAMEDYRSLPKTEVARKVVRYIENEDADHMEHDTHADIDFDDDSSEDFVDTTLCLNQEETSNQQYAEEQQNIITTDPKEGNSTEKQEEQTQQPPLRRSGRVRKKPARYELMTNVRLEKEQQILSNLFKRTGGAQFLLHENPDVPLWILDDARQKEIGDNWQPYMNIVQKSSIPNNANVIGSHFVYKIKEDYEPGLKTMTYKLKARLCVHGNHDDKKDIMRSDAAVVSHFGFRLIYSISVTHGMRLAKLDIKGAYPRSGEAKRQIYVRPPTEMGLRSKMFLLLSTMYGLVSAGRKWKRVSDAMILNQMGMQSLIGVPQFFYKIKDEKLVLILAKYVDDLLIAGINQDWIEFAKSNIEKAFELSEFRMSPQQLCVNSTEVEQSREFVTLSMNDYSRQISAINLSPLRRKQIGDDASSSEIRKVRSLAGCLVYIGIACYPPALLLSSIIQQSAPYLRVGNIKEFNGMVRDMLRRERTVIYQRPSIDLSHARIVAFCDAGYPHRSIHQLKPVAQESCLAGISFGEHKGDIFHLLYYHARKQRRISDSSFAAESIAAVSAYGVAMMIQDTISSLFQFKLPITLVTDSSGLHRNCATESTPRDKSTLQDITKLRMAYDEKQLEKIVWIPGNSNPADALTKPLPGATAAILDDLISSGKLHIDVNNERNRGKALLEEQ